MARPQGSAERHRGADASSRIEAYSAIARRQVSSREDTQAHDPSDDERRERVADPGQAWRIERNGVGNEEDEECEHRLEQEGASRFQPDHARGGGHLRVQVAPSEGILEGQSVAQGDFGGDAADDRAQNLAHDVKHGANWGDVAREHLRPRDARVQVAAGGGGRRQDA